MEVIAVKPLGYARLSQLPILPSNVFAPTVEPAVGVPQPSTILGVIGNAIRVKLDAQVVSADPLQGLGVLVDELLKRMKLVRGCLLAGPFVKIPRERGYKLALPVYSKTGTLLLDVEAVESLAEKVKVEKRHVIGRVQSTIQVGIHLEDYESGVRVVKLGYMFRKLYTYVVDASGNPVDYEFLYIADFVEKTPPATVVRLGGEQRQALLGVEDLGKYRVLESLLNRLATLDIVEKPGTYMLLTPAPLFPLREKLYYGEGVEPRFSRVLGVPTPDGPKPYVVRVGLGYSEVINVRRPQLPALPWGSVVEIAEKPQLNQLALKLARAGYYQVLHLR